MVQENLHKFRATVAAVLGLSPDQVIDPLSSQTVDTWDSLNHINLISALEQEFGVTLPAETMTTTQSVAVLKELLKQHGVEL